MRLLLDQNLSPSLKSALDDIYPDTLHVKDVGLEAADDVEVWSYARMHELAIVSKDSDFRQLSFTFGHPPKVVWIRRGTAQHRRLNRYSATGTMTYSRSTMTNAELFLP